VKWAAKSYNSRGWLLFFYVFGFSKPIGIWASWILLLLLMKGPLGTRSFSSWDEDREWRGFPFVKCLGHENLLQFFNLRVCGDLDLLGMKFLLLREVWGIGVHDEKQMFHFLHVVLPFSEGKGSALQSPYSNYARCNALVVILLFLVDFSMFCVFYMKIWIYVNIWCVVIYYIIICVI